MKNKKEKPNKETIVAIKEVEVMEKDHSLGKVYNSVEELFNDLNANHENSAN